MSDINESVVVEVAEEQSADVLAAVTRLGVTSDDELLPEFNLELEPVTRAISGLVPRIDLLGDYALPSFPARFVEHFLSIAFD